MAIFDSITRILWGNWSGTWYKGAACLLPDVWMSSAKLPGTVAFVAQPTLWHDYCTSNKVAGRCQNRASSLVVGSQALRLPCRCPKSAYRVPFYELRATPATIGGSINLTPNALRLLEYLDVEVYGCRVDSIEIFSLHTGAVLGELPFQKFGPALRILREELLQALLRAAEKRGIPVVYNSKLMSIKDDRRDLQVTAVFANGKEVQGDFILGCDGVHSAENGIKAHFRRTSMNSGRFGSLLASYVDSDRTKIYLGAVMETPEQNDKQGWKVRGNDHQRTLDEIERRYNGSGIPCINELVERVDDFVFYPVHNLGPGGDWSRGRVLLLGDTAHGMPPQGESTGLAIEDGVLLARVLSSSSEMSIQQAFQMYEKTRRPRIDTAYKEAVFRWEKVKDRSWLMQNIIEWLTWVFLWYKLNGFETSISYDVRQEKIIE
ncbi:FAD protein [Coleophoma cylindrospora]|uniref:FAD protein n=1 Tax=Coleophoma cylindrospora TaxID=1849047 RepID=A0A3D8Q4R4_9HELO|nr:FAD protein [Coleophoma cylindrospora]